MSKKVLKEDGTKRLIDQILASLRVGKYAIMDKVLNINSKNPVENGVITQAINGINNRIDIIDNNTIKFDDVLIFTNTATVNEGATHSFNFSYGLTDNGYNDFVVLEFSQNDEEIDGYSEVCGVYVYQNEVYPNCSKKTNVQLVTGKKSLSIHLSVYNDGSQTTMRGTVVVLLLK